ncbi:MAG: zf-TFIIB domain-containing protein [bacterium]
MAISDDEWIAAARVRAASGEWERSADEVHAELRSQTRPASPEGHANVACPYCDAHPALTELHRFEAQTATPLLYCNTCYGFWATDDALTAGPSESEDENPALTASLGPRRCRSCFGHLKPDNSCAKCGKTLALLDCPQCAKPMQRIEREGIQLDQCGPCMGVWFDTGEIAAVYHLVPRQDLAASTVDDDDDGRSPDWLSAAMTVGRIALPLLRL